VEETELPLNTLGHDEDDQEGDGKDGEEDPKSGLSTVGSVDEVSGRVRSRRALGVRRRQGAVARVVTMVVSLGTLGNRHRVSGVVRVGDGQGGSYGVKELHVVCWFDVEVFGLKSNVLIEKRDEWIGRGGTFAGLNVI